MHTQKDTEANKDSEEEDCKLKLGCKQHRIQNIQNKINFRNACSTFVRPQRFKLCVLVRNGKTYKGTAQGTFKMRPKTKQNKKKN